MSSVAEKSDSKGKFLDAARRLTWRLLSTGRAKTLGLLAALVLLGTGCGNPDKAILASLSEADQARFLSGRQAAVKCWTCHDLAGTVKKVGPSLLGVYGRRSGMAPGYEGSDAMRAASIVWNDQSLGAFLLNPGAYVPGNRMVSPGVSGGAQLADLLFYLRHVTRPGAREMQAN